MCMKRNTSATVRIESGDKEMIGVVRNKRMLATFLGVALLLGVFGSLSVGAQGRNSRRYHRGTHHSRAKGALVGGTLGLIGGALIGGRKGGLIGTGAGAGTGYLIQRHRNQRRHRRYYRRY